MIKRRMWSFIRSGISNNPTYLRVAILRTVSLIVTIKLTSYIVKKRLGKCNAVYLFTEVFFT